MKILYGKLIYQEGVKTLLKLLVANVLSEGRNISPEVTNLSFEVIAEVADTFAEVKNIFLIPMT